MTSPTGGLFRATTAALLVSAASAAQADHSIGAGGGSGGGPVLTIPAETLAQGQLVAGLRTTLARPDAYSDAQLIDLAGRHIHAHTADYTLTSSASLAYGLANHLTLAASLPYVHRNDFREGEHSHDGGGAVNSVARQGGISGVGDLTLIGQYQFAHSHHDRWGVSLLAGLKVPTGATRRKTPDGERFETEHQPGTGSLDPLVGLAASKHWDRWSLDGNVLHQFSTRGAQHTELGDRTSINLALGYSLTGEEHHHDGEGAAPHGHANWSLFMEANAEREGRQKIDGAAEADSGGRVLYLAPGARFTAASGWSAAFSAGVPIWQHIRRSHPDNAFRLTLAVSKNF
jgi:hypothetical protein